MLTDDDIASLEKCLAVIPRLDDAAAAAEAIFNLDGRRLADVAREYPAWFERWLRAQSEIDYSKKVVENMLDKVEGKLWRKYNDDHRRTLSAKDITMYIAAEESVVLLKQAKVDVEFVREKVIAIVKALESMNWTISNLTKLHVASIEKMAIISY